MRRLLATSIRLVGSAGRDAWLEAVVSQILQRTVSVGRYYEADSSQALTAS
ncbi:hypothetical protein AHiyo6_17030, partial [Arthrobacter sp. Hiyo6]